MTYKAKSGARKRAAQRLVEAVSHPIRLEALRIFYYRTASANEVSKELGESLGVISYHVKVLKDFGCIEPVKSEPRRGAIEHYYRATTPAHFDDKAWAKLSKAEREGVSLIVLRAIVGEVMRAVEHGTFDARQDRHLSWVPMEVDAQGWAELRDKQLELLEDVARIKAESAERLLAEKKQGTRVVAAMLGFETPPGFGFIDPERTIFSPRGT